MGGAASKATRKYPSPSTLSKTPTSPAHPSASKSIPFPPPAQTKEHHPADVRAKLEGMPSGLDPKLAARLNELGPIAIARPESKIPQKMDDMMTILKNRANIEQTLEEEAQGDAAQKHISAVIIKEILKGKQRGWNAARISKEYNLDHSVVEKLGNQYAIPIFNKEGIGEWPKA